MKILTSFLFTLLLSSVLFGQSWIRQNPFPKLAQLYDVKFDGDYGLAVGAEGTIFTTTNGGTAWIPRVAPDTADILQCALVVPGTNGQVMLAGGNLLLRSIDGGETWSINYLMIDGVFKVEVLPSGEWIALGNSFGIRSNDGGLVWQPFNYPGNNVTAGDFTSTMNGWVQFGGFNNNQVWVTTDGGMNWELRDSTKFSIITALDMLDDNHGFLSTNSDVYTTTDGGNQWMSLHANPSNSITDLFIANDNQLWACLNNGNVFYSLTSGAFWTEYNPNLINSNSTLGICADTSGNVWMAGKYVSILYSSNYGVDWMDQIPNSKASLFQPHFFNELTGIAGGSDGTLLRTTDGGGTWTRTAFSSDENFFAVQMIGAQNMVAGSSSGSVFLSHDQGMTWDTIGKNLGRIAGLVAANLMAMVIVTENGKIYRTTDGGSNWNIVSDDPGSILTAIDFAGLQNGWVTSYDGTILHSDNFGITWTPQFQDGHTQFDDIAFTSDLDGYAVASNFIDSLWYTHDGGTSWNRTRLPVKTFWHGVSFTNQDTGWIAGGSVGYGVVLRTNDHGITWAIDHESPEALLGIYAVPDQETVWAVGFGGNIVKFSPCNFLPAIADLTGESQPCEGDTITYSVTSSDVDIFDWTFPSDWLIFGNPNTSSIQVIVGTMPGEITVQGSDVCTNMTDTLSLTATPNPVPIVLIEESNGTLTCNIGSAFYEWFLNGGNIPGANDQSYIPVESGSYQCVVTVPGTGCKVRSNEINIMIEGTQGVNEDKISIFPIPAKSILYVSSPLDNADVSQSSVTLFSLDGAITWQGNLQDGKIDVSELRPGFYILMLRTQNEVILKKVILE